MLRESFTLKELQFVIQSGGGSGIVLNSSISADTKKEEKFGHIQI